MATRTCSYCSLPAFAGGRRAPLCEPHFEIWLIISHLKRVGLPITVATIRVEMIGRTGQGHIYGFELDQVPELLAQMAPELQGAKVAA